ncbi:MAG: hypothetical protein ACOYN0_11530 [Phycisphaerales bacterium]
MLRSTLGLVAFSACASVVLADPPFDINLIQNPGAEAGPSSGGGTAAVTLPGWLTSTNVTVASYGFAGLPAQSSPGSPDRGSQFFIGGPGPSTNASMSQLIDVSAGASEIDLGRVDFRLSAFLGGVAGQDDSALIALIFSDAASESLGTANLLGPTNAGRNNVTGMLYRQRLGDLPAGTRSITIIVSMSRSSSNLNEGCADDLQLELTLGPCAADWNNDSGVDGDDVIAFFGDWDISEGDFNEDGGTDGDDVIAFFSRWDAGC